MCKFKEFTKDLKIRQVDLQQILHYSQASISKFCRGNALLSDEKIQLLIDHYGKDVVDKYITDDVPVTNTKNVSNSGKSEDDERDCYINKEDELLSIIKKQQDTIASLILRIEQSQQQITQLIELINKKSTLCQE